MLAMTRLPQKGRIVSEVLYSKTDIAAVQLLTLLCQYEWILLINGGWSLDIESNSSSSFSNKTFQRINTHYITIIPRLKAPKMTASRDIISVSNPVLLEKIDKLRDWNIGHHVPLPQVKLKDKCSPLISHKLII